MKGFVKNIEGITLNNEEFRRVVGNTGSVPMKLNMRNQENHEYRKS